MTSYQCGTNRDKIREFLLKANNFHPAIKFTAEISETETIFLDTSSVRRWQIPQGVYIVYLTCEHISNLQRPFNTRIGQIPLRLLLRKTLDILPHALRIEVILQKQSKNISQKSNSLKEKRAWQIETEPHERKFYPWSHNTIRLCLTYKKYSWGNGT